MGVMGAGKTTVGNALAAKLGCAFYDADDFHPPGNIAKLRSGIALHDDDRAPWIDEVGALIQRLHERGETAVIACSSLTSAIRRQLQAASDGVVFVYLRADPETIAARLRQRRDHFADPSLLGSQYATLEVPSEAICVDTGGTPDEIVAKILDTL
jgi:gluconokinase